ncbi:cofilin [Tulasnella sp. 403]|nr:cofilin [Tulasnella sp. 403]
MSGVKAHPDCVTTYNELKLRKKYRSIIYKINDKQPEIVVERTMTDADGADYEKFILSLPEDEPRWAVYDFEYSLGDEGKRNKLVFIAWSPDGSKIKQKMTYASSKDELRRSLVGIATEIQGTDTEEISHQQVLEKVKGR